MAFKVNEQGRNDTIFNSGRGFLARVSADHFVFNVYWNENGLIKVSGLGYDVSPDYESGLKFADLFDKLKNRKSDAVLKQYLIQGMDKIVSDAQHGILKDMCTHYKGSESYYDPEDKDFYEGTNEELIHSGIYDEMDLVSQFGLTLKNDSPELRKQFVRSLQTQKQNVLDAMNI